MLERNIQKKYIVLTFIVSLANLIGGIAYYFIATPLVKNTLSALTIIELIIVLFSIYMVYYGIAKKLEGRFLLLPIVYLIGYLGIALSAFILAALGNTTDDILHSQMGLYTSAFYYIVVIILSSLLLISGNLEIKERGKGTAKTKNIPKGILQILLIVRCLGTLYLLVLFYHASFTFDILLSMFFLGYLISFVEVRRNRSYAYLLVIGITIADIAVSVFSLSPDAIAITTDIALGCIAFWSSQNENVKMKKSRIFLTIIAFFLIGALGSAIISPELKHASVLEDSITILPREYVPYSINPQALDARSIHVEAVGSDVFNLYFLTPEELTYLAGKNTTPVAFAPKLERIQISSFNQTIQLPQDEKKFYIVLVNPSTETDVTLGVRIQAEKN